MGQMTSDGNQPGYQGGLSKNAVTIAEVLGPAGYKTYMSGKWHVTKHLEPDGIQTNWPLQCGFDRFYGTIIGAGSLFDPWTLCRGNQYITPENDPDYSPDTYYYTDAISDNAARFIREHDQKHGDQPFFLYVSYTAAHWPMHALEKDIEKYKGKYDAGYAAIRKVRYERMKELGVIHPDWELSPAPGKWSDRTKKIKEWDTRCMEVYAAMIDSMDQGIGRVVASLENTGKLENTLVLFLQDNGGCAESRGRRAPKEPIPKDINPMGKDELQTKMVPERSRDGRPVRTGPDAMPGPTDTYIAYGRDWANVSNTPFRMYKSTNHEGGISSPLIAHWPRGLKAKNEFRHEPSHLIDLMATCVDLSAAKYPSEFEERKIFPMEGRSLKAGFAKDRPDERLLMFEHFGKAAIRKGPWKLVRAGQGRPWELYEIEKDRSEMNDLANEKPELAETLAGLWEREAKRTLIYPKPKLK